MACISHDRLPAAPSPCFTLLSLVTDAVLFVCSTNVVHFCCVLFTLPRLSHIILADWTSVKMTMAAAQQHHIFGLKGDVSNNICFHDDQTVVYPAGANCILYNMDRRSQKFIQCSEKFDGMTAMAVSPNRRYVAFAEKGAEKATITIYDLHSLRKKKTLSSTEVQSNEYVSLAFSPDSKYLVGQGGTPDYTLVYWSWEKAKVLATTKTSNPQGNNEIYQVSFNPQDSTQLFVSGNGIFKLFRYSEANLKQVSVQKADLQNYLCQAWISDERVIVGTDNGRLLLFESGEFRGEVPTQQQNFGDEKDKTITSINETEVPITAISAYSKGFACAYGYGTVHIYEKTDDKDHFRKVREIKIPEEQNQSDPRRSQMQAIKCIAISPSEENIVASTSMNQLYCVALSGDLGKGDQSFFENLSQSFHSGAITGVDVCIRKPLIATCGKDKSVRIWNYETSNLEMYKEFSEEALSIALHPSGLYVLVGFSNKLHMMNLLIDDIRSFKEFPIKVCRECSFSHGGHLFAAVEGTTHILVYNTMTFDNLADLSGHSDMVRSMAWSADDRKIVSCGEDGAVYEWDLVTGERVGESVLKTCFYTNVAIASDGKTIFAVGSDKTIKEISDSQILREVDANDVILSSVAISNSGRMLFAGSSSGALRAYKFPLTVPGEWTDFPGHGSAIVKMRITYDDQYLVTISSDACVMLWKIQDKEGRSLKREKEIGYAEEILITKSDLEEKNTMMAERKTRIDELQMENEYQLRLKDMNYNEKIKELTEKFIQEMESLKTKNQVLKTEKDKEEVKHDEEVKEVMEKHSAELQDLESANNQKLMLEYEKYQELQGKSQKMQESYDRKLQEMVKERENAMAELTQDYKIRLDDKINQLEQAYEEQRQQSQQYELTKQQIEEDGDREILNIKSIYEKELRKERDNFQKLKNDTGIMKKKFTSQQKEIDDHKEEIKRYQTETMKLNNVIRNLEKDIQGLKKEILERDETIQDKERRIYDLKKKNQELEKFKFVLDYKIKELKKQIEPRENDIKAMKEQIQEMESELERFHKQNTSLELNIDELRNKLKATEKEMHQERQRVREREAVIEHMKTDFHNCVGYIQEPKMLKDSIRTLYQKYGRSDTMETNGVDSDIQKEYGRQREHLERSVASLRKKLAKDSEIHRADNVRIMQENVSLIKEINDLRRELKTARSQVHDLEAALGLHRKSNKEHATETLAQITSTNKNAQLEKDLTEKVKVIQLQQDEIVKLRGHIKEASEQISRPPSGAKLPPMTAIL